MRSIHTVAVALLVTASMCAAQRTWIVDAASGPGFDFTDLPPAFAAVADGDRVLVRAGSYGAATLTRGIQLIAVGPASIVPRGGVQAFVVSGIRAGAVCSIAGFSIGSPVNLGVHLQIDGCAGSVVLQQCDILGNTRGSAVTTLVSGSAAVSLHRCGVWGAINVSGSRVTATECTFRFSPSFGVQPPPTISLSGSTIDLANSLVIGTGGVPGGGLGVWATNSSLTVRKGSRIEGGATISGPVPSIDGQSTTNVVADPAAVLTPAPQALQSLSTVPLPTLTASLAPLGGSLAVTLNATQSDLYVLFAAVPAPPTSLPFGALWLQPTSMVLVGSGVLATGPAVTTFPVPNDPVLDGLALAFQGASGATAVGVRLSNSVGCIVGR